MTAPHKELGLDDYVQILGRRWRAIAGSLLVVVAVVLAFTLTRDKVYESDAEVLIMTESTTGLFSFEPSVETQLVRNPLSELQLAQSAPFRQAADASTPSSAEIFLELVAPPGSESIEESSVLRVGARDQEPEQAQAAAQAYADNYVRLRAESDLATAESSRTQTAALLDRLVEERATLQTPISDLRNQRLDATTPAEITRLDRQIADLESVSQSAIDGLTAQITEVGRDAVRHDQTIAALLDDNSAARVLNAADLPVSPVSPNVSRNIIVAVFLGLLLGLLLATLRELFDSNARNSAEVARVTDTPFIAAIPDLDLLEGAPGGVATFDVLPSGQAKSYGILLDSLRLGGVVEHLGIIAVTGDHAGVGTTQTVVNLAHVEARRGTPVCVVDAALATPGVAARCALDENHLGLADLLEGDATLDDAVVRSHTDGFDVIGTGNVAPATLARLRSAQLGELLAQLAMRYELVVVDLPPVAGPVDSSAIAAACDGVVVLYDPEQSELDDIVESVELLRSVGAVPIGVVSNRT